MPAGQQFSYAPVTKQPTAKMMNPMTTIHSAKPVNTGIMISADRTPITATITATIKVISFGALKFLLPLPFSDLRVGKT